LLLLVAIGLLVWVLLQPKASPQATRLNQALAEVKRQGERLSYLREPLRQVQGFGRDLAKLLPQMAELERFLGKPNLDHTRDRLLARHNELSQIFDRGVEYLERLGAELVLVNPPQEPQALDDLPIFLIELREALHPATPSRG